jgi:protocatechuate 3,4-dioxygenase alpha subunit
VTLPATPSQTVGPYYAIGLCRRPENELVPDGIPITGRLLDGDGEPIPDGMIELWSSTAGVWGRCGTQPEGAFRFVAPKPPAAPGEAPRLDVMVFARGLLRHQLTRLYFPDEQEANAADPVLSSLAPDERATLVAAAGSDGLRFDIRMQGDSQTVFFA